MKLSLPYSTKEFEHLQKVKTYEVTKFRRIPESNQYERKAQLEKILPLVDKMYEYININEFNKNGKNRCRFGNAEDTEDVCEIKFKNTLANYSSNGNCCKSCNSVILNRTKYVQN